MTGLKSIAFNYINPDYNLPSNRGTITAAVSVSFRQAESANEYEWSAWPNLFILPCQFWIANWFELFKCKSNLNS